jgi:branched-chain amino acid transport system permease protein
LRPIAEVFFFVEFNPLADWTGGENDLSGGPTPSFNLGFTTIHFTTGWSLYQFLAVCYFVGIVIGLRIVRSPVGAILSAIRDNPLRAMAVGHNIHGYKLAAFVIAAAYAGFAGGLLGVLRDFLQAAVGLGAAWKLVLGIVFVLLVCFLRRGIVGGIEDLYGRVFGKRTKYREPAEPAAEPEVSAAGKRIALEPPVIREPATATRRRAADSHSGPILQASGLTKRYGGLLANRDIDFTVHRGELRGIIGPKRCRQVDVLQDADLRDPADLGQNRV